MNRYLPSINVRMEKGTERVPDDGQWHVWHDGVVIDSFKTRGRAEKRYLLLVEELGGSVKAPNRKSLTPEERAAAIRAEADAIERERANAYWANSGKYQGKKY